MGAPFRMLIGRLYVAKEKAAVCVCVCVCVLLLLLLLLQRLGSPFPAQRYKSSERKWCVCDSSLVLCWFSSLFSIDRMQLIQYCTCPYGVGYVLCPILLPQSRHVHWSETSTTIAAFLGAIFPPPIRL